MPDYTRLGYQKIAHQASVDPALIRCPRDGAVMRVLATRARHDDRGVPTFREFPRLPAGAGWHVTELDLECPACRRRAEGIRPVTDNADDRRQCNLFEVSSSSSAAPTLSRITR